MEVITELLHLIKKEGIRSTGQFHPKGKGNLTDRYVYLVLEKKLTDDDQLAHHLYASDRSDPRYKNLKKRVKQKLLESIPLVDREYLGFKSEFNQQYYKCLKAADLVMYLSRVAAYSTTIKIIKSHFPIAQKYQFYDILRDFTYILIKIYAMKGESGKIDNLSTMLREYILEENYATLAHTLYFQSIAGLVRKSALNNSELQAIEENLSELQSISKKSKSTEIKYWFYYLKTSYLILIKDSDQLDETFSEFELIFEDWSNYPPARKIIFSIQKLSVLFYLKEYSAGIDFARQHEHVIKTHQNNWVLFKKLEFYHAINSDLDKAIAVYREVTDSSFYKMNNNPATAQLWLINYAYLQFMLSVHQHPQSSRFNIYKFLNEVEIYNRDKAGYNFSIIIIELLFCLLQNNIDRYIDKMTSLLAYRLRHLKSRAFKRSNVFAQLLLEVDKQNFDAGKLRKTSAKKAAYLASIEDRLNINEWEIVGYDTLWEVILEMLEKRT